MDAITFLSKSHCRFHGDKIALFTCLCKIAQVPANDIREGLLEDGGQLVKPIQYMVLSIALQFPLCYNFPVSIT